MVLQAFPGLAVSGGRDHLVNGIYVIKIVFWTTTHYIITHSISRNSLSRPGSITGEIRSVFLAESRYLSQSMGG
jgi:hypothetical protein